MHVLFQTWRPTDVKPVKTQFPPERKLFLCDGYGICHFLIPRKLNA